MPQTFDVFVNGDLIEAQHVMELHLPIQNLQRGSPYFAGASSGTGAAYQVSIDPPPDVPYAQGMFVYFVPHQPSAQGATLMVNGGAALPLVKDQGVPLASHDLVPGQMVLVVHSGGQFHVVGGSAPQSSFPFGDGSDGDVTLSSGLTVLSRDMYYRNLVLTGTGAIRTNGYKLFVSQVLDLSGASGGAIRNSGADASGATGGSARPANSVGGGSAGTDGASGSLGPGVAAVAAAGLDPCNGGNGGGSQASGSGTQAGAPVSPGSAGNNRTDLRVPTLHLLRGASLIGGGVGGRGGSSGGGDGSNSGGSGGGGGGAAGVVALFAHTIATGSSTPVGVIRAMGGNGAAGLPATAGNCGGGSGGAGGGGGWIYVVYANRSGPTVSNALRATGGDGASGGTGSGSGTAGGGGDGGGGGQVIVVNASTQATIVVNGNRTSLPGGAASGVTPGAGANGRSAQADL